MQQTIFHCSHFYTGSWMIACQQGWGTPMVHDLKPYPTMKGSGMPWLGEVPKPLDEEDTCQKMNSLLSADLDDETEEAVAWR